jgi:signal transduction histidine kinase
MADDSKKRLRRATNVYWFLLLYIIAALIWWLLSLESQNQQMYVLRKEAASAKHAQDNVAYQRVLADLDKEKRRETTKYLLEGITFLGLIIVGAAYIYRLVRKQFILQQQQQNFVMAVTHELKTPIAVSRLNLETLQKHQLDDVRRTKLLQMTLQETLRLDTLINNILISSQLEGHSYNMSREELNFSDLANDVACQFTTRYPERKLLKSIQPDVEINGDPLLLKLLLSNLLENANKYSPKDKPVELNLVQKNNKVEARVSDEGPGIASEERAHIFEKFYRIGNEQTRRSQGTGLGLYLCSKIAKDHRGDITVTDNQPTGSNFIVTFY